MEIFQKIIEASIVVFGVIFFLRFGAFVQREFGSFESLAIWLIKRLTPRPVHAADFCRKCGHAHAPSGSCVLPRQ